MTDTAWRRWTARLAWLTAVTFLLGSVLGLYLTFLAPMSGPPPDAGFVDNLLAEFEDQQSIWIVDLAASLSFAVGFVAIAALGATLRHVLGRDDPRTILATVAFLVAGTIALASQLIYIGATEVATNPEYCDCGFLAEEIISRAMINFVVNGIVSWMTDGFTVLFAVGLLAVASAASAAGASVRLPTNLVAFTRLLSVVGLAAVIWGRVAIPLLIQAGYDEIDYWLIGSLIIAVVAGVLVPIWAGWLARALRPTEPDVEA